MRILVEIAIEVGQVDAAEGRRHAVGMLGVVDAGIDQRLGHRAIDGEARVERVERVLEDELGLAPEGAQRLAVRPASATPSKAIEPAVGSASFSIRRPSVVLPQPDSPTMATASPAPTSKLTPSSACTAGCWPRTISPSERATGKCFTTSRSSTSACHVAGSSAALRRESASPSRRQAEA